MMVVCARLDERGSWKTLRVCGEEAERGFGMNWVGWKVEVQRYLWPEVAPLSGASSDQE